jgi:hypothetical protein
MVSFALPAGGNEIDLRIDSLELPEEGSPSRSFSMAEKLLTT